MHRGLDSILFQACRNAQVFQPVYVGHHRMQAVLDPLTPEGQRLAPVLLAMRSMFGASVQLLLTPRLRLSSLPLQSYYAYAAPRMPSSCAPGCVACDAEWPLPAPTVASFAALPAERVLTMNVDVPEPWLVEARSLLIIPQPDAALLK